ncbi:MAG: hypothetical protein HRU28_04565 [Rhizobiales bacterium]|nr:hypothetical protein [Hyphomicrobiales bacterium]
MAKFILLEALLFLMPFIIFLLYVRIFHKRKAIEALHPKNLAKLIFVGVFLMAIGAFYLSSLDDDNIGGVYIPAKMIDGVKNTARIE